MNQVVDAPKQETRRVFGVGGELGGSAAWRVKKKRGETNSALLLGQLELSFVVWEWIGFTNRSGKWKGKGKERKRGWVGLAFSRRKTKLWW